MSKVDWLLLGAFIVGFLLFIIGSNLFLWYGPAVDPAVASDVGYVGVFLFIGAIVAYLILYIIKEITKKPTPQNP